jgi:MFS family permease
MTTDNPALGGAVGGAAVDGAAVDGAAADGAAADGAAADGAAADGAAADGAAADGAAVGGAAADGAGVGGAAVADVPVVESSGRGRAGRSALGGAYWRLLASAGLSDLADGITKVALPLVAIHFTRSPVLIAGLSFAVTLPWLLFALQAGALADRLDRRKAMLGANCARGALVLVAVIALALGAGSIWALYVVALSIGVAETIYDTSAQSILPQVVRRDQLSRANGRLYAVQLGANQFAGPPLAGLLTAIGAVVAFAAPVGLWLVAIVALALVPGQFRVERTSRSTIRADIAEGLRFLWGHRLLRTLAIMVGFFNVATSATSAILVLFAVGPKSAMGLSEQVFGLLLATLAAGSVLGSFAIDWFVRRTGRSAALAVSLISGALFVGIPAVTTSPVLIGAAFFIGGIGIMFWNIVTVSFRQRVTPDRLLGRVNSCYRLVAWGTMPLGAALGGVLGEALGLRAVFAIFAVVTIAQVAGLLIVTNAHMDAAERTADEARPA